ncbi:MAG: dihydroneopterin triphosphate diphosphatase [Methylophilaceae bacterium]|jgi:dihydroneopterin triphosphate diphosphatase|nr:dihydroneopterin triphosphate diphosphatase [Methylophilaceae bacterium]
MTHQLSSPSFKTPISVLVLIYTADLKVLLIERADKAGFWQSVTGSIETEDADLRATAIREVLEETGLDATKFKLEDWQFAQTYEIYEHWRYRYAPGVTQNVEHVFGLELPAPVDVKLAPNEHVAYEWVDWRDAAKRVFSWTNVEALRLLGERHNLTL